MRLHIIYNSKLYQIREKNLKKKKNFFLKKIRFLEDEKLKKIINMSDGETLFSTFQGNLKTTNLKKKFSIDRIKNIYQYVKDFDINFDFSIFALFDKYILNMKKYGTKKWKIFAKISTPDPLDNIFVLKKSKLMLTTSFYDDKIKLWSFLGQKILFCGKSTLSEKIRGLVVRNDSSHFAIGSFTGKIYLYDNKGILVDTLKNRIFGTKKINISGSFPLHFFDKNSIFSGGNGSQLCQWDIRNGKTVKYWKGHKAEVENINSSPEFDIPDSFYVYSSDKKGILKKWDIRKEDEFLSFKCPGGKISSMVFI